MNKMHEYSTISHNDSWAKHIKKLSQSRESTAFSVSATTQRRQQHGLSSKPKWGK